MPPLTQVVHCKSLRLISGTLLWNWNARESFLAQAGTSSRLLMGVWGRSWWETLGVVCASQRSHGDKWVEKAPPSWREVDCGLILQENSENNYCIFLISSSNCFSPSTCDQDVAHKSRPVWAWALPGPGEEGSFLPWLLWRYNLTQDLSSLPTRRANGPLLMALRHWLILVGGDSWLSGLM